ncbi:RloB family protein [Streptomyces sp. NPDC058442]|uniref:RloB family protein n=1 Tax=Streptomyces sp. NPDC058442 TaxID=3346503 RepID=UPI00364C756C
MSRGQQDRQNRNQPRGRRRDPDAARPLRRPVQSYEDESYRVVYVAAEGEKTERHYIDLLNKTYGEREKFALKFSSTKTKSRPTKIVELAIRSASAPDDEKWAFFDRDAQDNRDADIPRAMRGAAEAGVQVALSHPSFELWLLLHFQQFTSQEGGQNNAVMRMLRGHRDAKGFEDYGRGSGDSGKRLDGQRSESLVEKEREKTAVRNARKLVSACPHGGCSGRGLQHTPIPGPDTESYADWTRRSGHAENCDPLKRDPSTDVWRLLVQLGIVEDEAATG